LSTNEQRPSFVGGRELWISNDVIKVGFDGAEVDPPAVLPIATVNVRQNEISQWFVLRRKTTGIRVMQSVLAV